jgi:hypothetical protein
MRSELQTLVLVALAAVGASAIPGPPAHADELHRFSSGALAGGESSGRGRYAGYFGRQFADLPPTSSPGAVAGCWYYYLQPVYQPPASSPAVIVSYGYYVPVRR